jgi:hypothetical protein
VVANSNRVDDPGSVTAVSPLLRSTAMTAARVVTPIPMARVNAASTTIRGGALIGDRPGAADAGGAEADAATGGGGVEMIGDGAVDGATLRGTTDGRATDGTTTDGTPTDAATGVLRIVWPGTAEIDGPAARRSPATSPLGAGVGVA